MPADGLFHPDLLQEIRDRFHFVDADPLSGPRTWLDSASGSLRLRASVSALADQSQWPDQFNRGSPGSARADETLLHGLDDVRMFLGARSGTIMAALSATHAVFRIVNAVLGSTAGSNLVTTVLEHPAVYDSTAQLARVHGKERRVAPVDPATGVVPPEAILDLVDGGTALIAMLHGSNMTGAVLDVATVAREARRRNPDVIVLVDGVQYAPHGPIDVDALGVDGYVFSPYKVFCVKGIGFAYLGDRLAPLDHWKLQGTAADNWVLGSPEDASYAAWSAVVDYLAWLGGHFTATSDRRTRVLAAMQASQSHTHALLGRMLDGSDATAGLRRLDRVRLHGMGDDLSARTCLALFGVDGLAAATCVERYRREGIRLHHRIRDPYSRHTLEGLGIAEGVRVAACHYNSPEEIDRFLEVTAEISRNVRG